MDLVEPLKENGKKKDARAMPVARFLDLTQRQTGAAQGKYLVAPRCSYQNRSSECFGGYGHCGGESVGTVTCEPVPQGRRPNEELDRLRNPRRQGCQVHLGRRSPV